MLNPIYLYNWYYNFHFSAKYKLETSFKEPDYFNNYELLTEKNIINTLHKWNIDEKTINIWIKDGLYQVEFEHYINNSPGPNIGNITKKSWESLSYIANNGKENKITEFLISLIEYNTHCRVYLKK